jgi:hypothetical protein
MDRPSVHESIEVFQPALRTRSPARRWLEFLMSGPPLVVALGLTGCGNMNRESRDRPGLFHRMP